VAGSHQSTRLPEEEKGIIEMRKKAGEEGANVFDRRETPTSICQSVSLFSQTGGHCHLSILGVVCQKCVAMTCVYYRGQAKYATRRHNSRSTVLR